MAGLIGEAADAGDGAFELNVFGQKVFVKETNGWAVAAQSPEALERDLPKDPLKLLGGLETTYDVAARVYVQNVPELYRSLFIDQLRAGVRIGFDASAKVKATRISLPAKSWSNRNQRRCHQADQ